MCTMGCFLMIMSRQIWGGGDILKRVIMNGMTGSSWRSKRFDRLCITVNSDHYRGIGN